MEERKIAIVFRNNYESIYEANMAYAKEKGRLSKKSKVLTFLFLTVSEIILFLLCCLENLFSPAENAFEVILYIAAIMISSAILIFLANILNKAKIRNTCQLQFEYGFDTDGAVRAEFDEEKLYLQSGYSKLCVPYDEINFVMSDRINFTYIIGSDSVVRNIPKNSQSIDKLYALDELLKEKLGNRFIYKM